MQTSKDNIRVQKHRYKWYNQHFTCFCFSCFFGHFFTDNSKILYNCNKGYALNVLEALKNFKFVYKTFLQILNDKVNFYSNILFLLV